MIVKSPPTFAFAQSDVQFEGNARQSKTIDACFGIIQNHGAHSVRRESSTENVRSFRNIVLEFGFLENHRDFCVHILVCRECNNFFDSIDLVFEREKVFRFIRIEFKISNFLFKNDTVKIRRRKQRSIFESEVKLNANYRTKKERDRK